MKQENNFKECIQHFSEINRHVTEIAYICLDITSTNIELKKLFMVFLQEIDVVLKHMDSKLIKYGKDAGILPENYEVKDFSA